MNVIYLIVLIILLIYFCKESFTGKKVRFAEKPEVRWLQRDMYDFPNYPLSMPDKYSYGRMFIENPPEISYKPGYW